MDENKLIKISDIGDNNSLKTNINFARRTVPGTSGNKKRNEDIDLQKITYECFYDLNKDGVVGKDKCETIKNFSFNKNNGDINWQPSFKQSGIYELKIVAKDNDKDKPLSDSKIFNLTVNNVNRPPSLIKIGDQKIDENSNIKIVDANDQNSGGDQDIDSEKLNYTCSFSQNKNQSNSKKCQEIRGLQFLNSSGKMTWKPDFFQSGDYYFKITGFDGGKIKDLKGEEIASSDSVSFMIKVKNKNRPPVIKKIKNQVINENDNIAKIDIQDNSSLNLDLKKARPSNPFKSNDEDIDLQKITYTCSFTLEGEKSGEKSCGNELRGGNFDVNSGVLKWKTDFFMGGVYKFKIKAIDNDPQEPLSDSTEFMITVNNVNRPQKLRDISNQTIMENKEINIVNAGDSSKLLTDIKVARGFSSKNLNVEKSEDEDIDLQKIIYSCFYDKIKDNKVSGLPCSKIDGLVFNKEKGELRWTPNFTQSGFYEFEITGTDNDPVPLKDSKIFSIDVENVNRRPDLIKIIDRLLVENQKMLEVDANDKTSSGDRDIDQEALTYNCYFDKILNKKLDGKENAHL